MTDVQLTFDALPPPTTTENYDALCQGIHPKNEIRDVKCCPDPMSGRFQYNPKDEVKMQTESDAVQPCKLYFNELGTGGWAGRQRREGKRRTEERERERNKGVKSDYPSR